MRFLLIAFKEKKESLYVKKNLSIMADKSLIYIYPDVVLYTVRQHLVIVHFLLLLLLSGTLFQMMSGVPHHCHHMSLV